MPFRRPNSNSQIRAAFKSIAATDFHGNFKRFINDKWRKDGTFLKMLVKAFGPDHPEGLSKKTLEECLAKRCFQTDHCLACLVDDPANFILMPKTLNTKFSFHSAQQFKKDYTGAAWTGAVHLVKKAIAMYRRVRRS